MRLRRAIVVIGIHSLLASVIAVASVLSSYLNDIRATLPDTNDPDVFLATESIVITDREERELYRLFDDEDRTSVALDALPAYVGEAFIGIEDERFFTRGCIDARALLRATLANARDFKSQGASTITQQLVRNVLLDSQKTFERKIREIMLACRLEKQFSREEILELYLNWIPFGSNIYGIEQASRRYFAVHAKDLTPAQAAVLAALPQRPTYFSPYGTQRKTTIARSDRVALSLGDATVRSVDMTIGLLPDEAKTPEGTVRLPGRSDSVLDAMLERGAITQAEYAAARPELLSTTFAPEIFPIHAPHFVMWMRERKETESLKSKKIVTTLDPVLQELATKTVAAHAARVREQGGAENIAMIAVDRKTNEVLAYVGNTSYFDTESHGSIDLVRSPRQPGSSFKPVVYAGALMNGMEKKSVVYDLPLTIGASRPRNYDGGFFGKMTIESALGRSRNIPAIKAFYWAGGEQAVLNLASVMGAPSPLLTKVTAEEPFEYGWPLALGTAETPLLEMVQIYATIANDGMYRPLVSMMEGERRQQTEVRAIPVEVAHTLSEILSNPEARPPNAWREMLTLKDAWAAVKTGTSETCTERGPTGCKKTAAGNTWTIGYTEELVVGVLVTNADNTPLHEEATGVSLASPIWKEFLEKAQEITPDVKTNADGST